MKYNVIYDGNCNLCVTLVQLLENLDKGQNFEYISMQDLEELERFGITSGDCEMGMILIDAENPERRWQGSDAAEEIGRILPAGEVFVVLRENLRGGLHDPELAWRSKASSENLDCCDRISGLPRRTSIS